MDYTNTLYHLFEYLQYSSIFWCSALFNTKFLYLFLSLAKKERMIFGLLKLLLDELKYSANEEYWYFSICGTFLIKPLEKGLR